MLIEKDKIYVFTPNKKVDSSGELRWVPNDKRLRYLRKVGKSYLFRSIDGGWLEGFTREQLRDHTLSESEE